MKGIRQDLRAFWKNKAALKTKSTSFLLKLFLYMFLIGVAYVCLFPFLYMLITSVKTSKDLSDITVNWIPSGIKIDNYRIAATSLEYMRSLKNTLIIVILADIGHIFSCSAAGYALARYKFRGQRLLFVLVMIAIVLPIQALIVPTYMIFSNLKMLNSLSTLILPTFFGAGLRGALFVFIFRQFFLGLPKELEEAAKIDGCSFIGAFYRIALPIARPTVLVVAVLSTVWHWNASFESSIYISKDALKPLSNKINLIVEYVNNPPPDLFENLADPSSAEQVVNIAVLMAGCMLILLPLIVAFAFVQRRFIQGVERSGLTGE